MLKKLDVDTDLKIPFTCIEAEKDHFHILRMEFNYDKTTNKRSYTYSIKKFRKEKMAKRPFKSIWPDQRFFVLHNPFKGSIDVIEAGDPRIFQGKGKKKVIKKTMSIGEMLEMKGAVEEAVIEEKNESNIQAESNDVVMDSGNSARLFELVGMPKEGENDDLTEIRSLGKTFEERFNDIGINSFDQIKNISDEAAIIIDELTDGKIDTEKALKFASQLKISE